MSGTDGNYKKVYRDRLTVVQYKLYRGCVHALYLLDRAPERRGCSRQLSRLSFNCLAMTLNYFPTDVTTMSIRGGIVRRRAKTRPTL